MHTSTGRRYCVTVNATVTGAAPLTLPPDVVT
jgi:hypothetical protein